MCYIYPALRNRLPRTPARRAHRERPFAQADHSAGLPFLQEPLFGARASSMKGVLKSTWLVVPLPRGQVRSRQRQQAVLDGKQGSTRAAEGATEEKKNIFLSSLYIGALGQSLSCPSQAMALHMNNLHQATADPDSYVTRYRLTPNTHTHICIFPNCLQFACSC